MSLLSRLSFLKLSLTTLIVLIALFLTSFHNQAFLTAVFKIIDDIGTTNSAFKIATFIALISLFSLLLSLIASKYIFKPLVILVLLLASIASFLMDNYGVIIDASMIKNIIETDGHILLNINLLKHILLLGILPAFFIIVIDIKYHSFFKEIFIRCLNLFILSIIFASIIFFYYQDFVTLNKNNRALRYLINPSYPIYALAKYINRVPDLEITAISPIGKDAQQVSNWKSRGKKSIVVLVLGDSARADNFSLNGYNKLTNPLLAQQDIINFPNTYSCSTMTADALPCLFSDFGQKDYSHSKAEHYENLLDVLTHANINVLWRGNDTDCQGVCARVNTEILSEIEEFCQNDMCLDEILLKDLQQKIDAMTNDAVIVLQQKGSSAPYYQRYNEKFRQFVPECQTTQIKECSREQIINTYDNSILYTDYFLNQVILFLQKNAERYNTAMLYLSNHGQSLGENGVYLYNLPYKLAPKEQIHIPLFIWLSPEYADSFNIDTECLKQNSGELYSHDNLFHSMLGMLDIQSAEYDAELDIFNRCRHY